MGPSPFCPTGKYSYLHGRKLTASTSVVTTSQLHVKWLHKYAFSATKSGFCCQRWGACQIKIVFDLKLELLCWRCWSAGPNELQKEWNSGGENIAAPIYDHHPLLPGGRGQVCPEYSFIRMRLFKQISNGRRGNSAGHPCQGKFSLQKLEQDPWVLLVDSNIRITTNLAKDLSMRLLFVSTKERILVNNSNFPDFPNLDVLNFVFSTLSNCLLQINSHLFRSHKKRK